MFSRALLSQLVYAPYHNHCILERVRAKKTLVNNMSSGTKNSII